MMTTTPMTTENNETALHEGIVYAVYDELNTYHVGKEKAISANALCESFSISERLLRDVIATIRKSTDFERIIGSSNKGYYVCTEEDFERTNQRLEKQAYSLLKVAYANRRKAAKDGQGKFSDIGAFCHDFIESYGEKEKETED